MKRALVALLISVFTLGHSVQAVDVIFGYEDPSQNKFKNWDFESDLSNNDWTVSAATVTRVSGGHTGYSSVKIQSRYLYSTTSLYTLFYVVINRQMTRHVAISNESIRSFAYLRLLIELARSVASNKLLAV